jgi:hypothetical protein
MSVYIHNCVVAFSNLVIGLPILHLLSAQANSMKYALIVCAMCASFVFHLSETKHQLPGLPILRNYTWHFLQVDRFFAILAALYVFANFISWYLGIIGFVLLGISEFFSEGKKWRFTITHSLWHVCAFICLYLT